MVHHIKGSSNEEVGTPAHGRGDPRDGWTELRDKIWVLNSEHKNFFIISYSGGLVLICMDSYDSESRRILVFYSIL